MRTLRIAVIAGDGVGQEVIPQAKRVLERIGRQHEMQFTFQDFDWGSEYYFRNGRMMPADAIVSPCTTTIRSCSAGIPSRRNERYLAIT